MSGRGNTRPMPEGFAEVAWTMSYKRLAAMFNTGQDAVLRWRQELGPDPRVLPDTPPDDFAGMIGKLNRTQMRAHYGISDRRLDKWLKAIGVKDVPRLYPHSRHLPDDFAELARGMSQTALTRHYKADWTTIKRWIKESGVTPAAVDYAAIGALSRGNPSGRGGGVVFRGHPGSSAIGVMRDMRPDTIHDRAADELRRNRWAVHRCDERGRYAEKGKLWRVGNVICTPDELLMRADKCRSRAA